MACNEYIRYRESLPRLPAIVISVSPAAATVMDTVFGEASSS